LWGGGWGGGGGGVGVGGGGWMGVYCEETASFGSESKYNGLSTISHYLNLSLKP